MNRERFRCLALRVFSQTPLRLFRRPSLHFSSVTFLRLQHHTPAAWRDHPSLSYGTDGEKIHITRVPFGSVGALRFDVRSIVSIAIDVRISPLASAGKYHVEQDPQYALVHLQFVHWADKLLKVITFMWHSRAVFSLPSAPVDC